MSRLTSTVAALLLLSSAAMADKPARLREDLALRLERDVARLELAKLAVAESQRLVREFAQLESDDVVDLDTRTIRRAPKIEKPKAK